MLTDDRGIAQFHLFNQERHHERLIGSRVRKDYGFFSRSCPCLNHRSHADLSIRCAILYSHNPALTLNADALCERDFWRKGKGKSAFVISVNLCNTGSRAVHR